MPCYTNQTATVDFGKNTDVVLLDAALEYLGISRYSCNFNRETGLLTLRGVSTDLATIKRAYSEQVVEQTAKRNGWSLTWTVNANGNKQAEVSRANR